MFMFFYMFNLKIKILDFYIGRRCSIGKRLYVIIYPLLYLISAHRPEWSSFLLVAELVVVVEPAETKPAIKKDLEPFGELSINSDGNLRP